MSEEHESETKRITEIVDSCALKIREHVDTVQIFITLHRDDGLTTLSYEKGLGNFHARQGQVQEWIVFQTQYQKNEAIRRDGKEEE